MTMFRTTIAAAAVLIGLSGISMAQEKPAQSLDQLLQTVRQGTASEKREMEQRIATFRSQRNQQAQLLRNAEAERDREEARSERLEKEFDEVELQKFALEDQLKEKLGTLGELFGTVRASAGSLAGITETSIVSAQYPGRAEFLSNLQQKSELPEVAELEELWRQLEMEIKASGEVVKFDAMVTNKEGVKESREVVRVGVFNLVSDGQYLNYNVTEAGDTIEAFGAQPGRWTGSADDLQGESEGYVGFGVDPSAGRILGLLVQVPGILERVDQGGIVGYIILIVGAFGIALVLWRLIDLQLIGGRVKAQMKTTAANSNNPLGRVMAVYEENPNVDVETLELKLDEAILKNTPAIERGIPTMRVITVVAPLMGLLGTVTGMIQTFTAITLFGTGDPKIMAGGISQALVTTVLGLTVAIPMTLLQTLVATRARGLVHILEEQAAGIISAHAEKK